MTYKGQVEDKKSRRKKQTPKTNSSSSFQNTSLKLKPKIPGKVKENRRQFAEPIWQAICDRVGKEGRIKEKEIAEDAGCSIRTVQRVLEDFERESNDPTKDGKLIETKPYNGPGEGIWIKNKWLIKREKIKQRFLWKLAYDLENSYLRNQGINSNSLGTTGLDNISNILSKGSPRWRKVAMMFREMVELLTDYAKYSSVIVGKCLQIITNKHIDLARDLYRGVKRFLRRELGLSAFYQWLRGWYLPTSWNLLSRHKDELASKKRSKEIEEARKSWQGIPDPPSIRDFARTTDWLKATENWHQKYVKGNSTQTDYQIEGRFP